MLFKRWWRLNIIQVTTFDMSVQIIGVWKHFGTILTSIIGRSCMHQFHVTFHVVFILGDLTTQFTFKNSYFTNTRGAAINNLDQILHHIIVVSLTSCNVLSNFRKLLHLSLNFLIGISSQCNGSLKVAD